MRDGVLYKYKTKEFSDKGQKHVYFGLWGVLWNSLNKLIKESANVLQFKKRYKRFIFDKYRSEGF